MPDSASHNAPENVESKELFDRLERVKPYQASSLNIDTALGTQDELNHSSNQDEHTAHPPSTSKSEERQDAPRPFSAFSQRTKWVIVALTGITATFSPISSNILTPAIPAMAAAFGRSEQDISLAMTIYMVFQAVTPSIFGSLSDTIGRRPVYIISLSIYVGANIGLACCPVNAYWLLLFLRAIQATGGSAVVSCGAGAMQDIAEPHERGKYYSLFQVGALFGPAFGPLLGGVFSDSLGWRAIFWFLTIAAGVDLVVVVTVLPETLRAIVGDGSVPAPPWNRTLWAYMKITRRKDKPEMDILDPNVPLPYEPFASFERLLNPGIAMIFVFVSLMYLQFYCNLTLFSTALKNTYNLSELKIGLSYLPNGCGSICASLLNGRQIDFYYRREKRRVGGSHREKPHEFRLEWTRFRCIIPFMSVFLAACIGQGWCLAKHAPLAATLVLGFFVGLGSATLNPAGVYAQDCSPGRGGSVSASLNLIRCAFGAIGTGTIQLMYNRMGPGWAMVLLSGICVAGIPLPLIVITKGRRWRLKNTNNVRSV
ncbi:major facilitator superfamily domain-containing protein [Naematelia encephala]|uniref:Major facilitator superfamily domain-containing protein n=1 Tax=Naematelia encephala TaxID=71784 RepID=A0A1Y2APW2_9TREE|nr:major facilitator superfamily domain-containing protein [Naematelia encephala]